MENFNRKFNAEITAVGMFVPEKILDNKQLEKLVDTNDEWIMSRTGIKERRIHENGPTSEMATKAAEDLIKSSGLDAETIDVIIVATVTPDMVFPATACLVQDNIGANNAWGYDLSAACSGFLFALQSGTALIESGSHKKVLVIGADKMSSVVNYKDRNTCILFGDLAAAVLLEPTTDLSSGIQNSILRVDGAGRDSLHLRGGGSLHPASEESLKNDLHYVYQDGKSVFKAAVKGMADISVDIMKANNLTADDVAYLVPHQANKRIIDATGSRMGLPPEKVMVNIEKYGNTTGATIPSCLVEYYRAGKLKKGDKIILSAFGAGFSWGATYIVWSMD